MEAAAGISGWHENSNFLLLRVKCVPWYPEPVYSGHISTLYFTKIRLFKRNPSVSLSTGHCMRLCSVACASRVFQAMSKNFDNRTRFLHSPVISSISRPNIPIRATISNTVSMMWYTL
jgi:hypothetical protein